MEAGSRGPIVLLKCTKINHEANKAADTYGEPLRAHLRSPPPLANTIMNEKWKKWYRWGTRALCPFCVTIVPLIFFDLIVPAKEHDEAVIVGKAISHQIRGADSHIIRAKGRYSYREDVSPNVYQKAQLGDTLRVSLTPIFSEWKTIEVIRAGNVIVSARGTDLYWMAAFGLFFLLSLAAFLPEQILFSTRILPIIVPVTNFVGVLLWWRLIQLWTGQIEKM